MAEMQSAWCRGHIPAGSLPPPHKATFRTSPAEEKGNPCLIEAGCDLGEDWGFLVTPASHPASNWTSGLSHVLMQREEHPT